MLFVESDLLLGLSDQDVAGKLVFVSSTINTCHCLDDGPYAIFDRKKCEHMEFCIATVPLVAIS